MLAVCLLAGIVLQHTRRLPENAPGTVNALTIHLSLLALTLHYLHDFSFDASHLVPVLMPWVLFAIGALGLSLRILAAADCALCKIEVECTGGICRHGREVELQKDRAVAARLHIAQAALRFALGVLVFSLAAVALAQTPAPQELLQAQRSIPGQAASRVALPDRFGVEPGQQGPLLPVYTLRANIGVAPSRIAIYLPGLFNHARIRVNGHVVFDTLGDPPHLAPRGADRLLLTTLPDEFVRPGVNEIEIVLQARRSTSLSTVWVGPVDELRRMHRHKRWWQVFAPVVAAATIFALSVCVLLLWVRQRRETLYAYFGIGGVVWSLHNVWAVLPDPLLAYPHFAIWWTLGFGFFVAPIVVFCIRLAQWQVPRFERALWFALGLGPILVYAAHAFGALDPALTYWRLFWVGVASVGGVAVASYAMTRRDFHAVLLLLAGATAFAFGARDWLITMYSSDNNPVLLTAYAGLMFFPLVAWMLIDGFVQASRELESLNAQLERRVAAKSAELLAALAAMRSAKEGAEAANRAKSSFLAAASHDLRQPMHALGLYLATLRGETLTAVQGDLVERMSDSVAALDTLFDALLDISRIDAGAIEPKPSAFAIEPMLHRLAEDFARQAADKGLRLSVRVASAARRLNAHSDPLLVERMLRNLLANAVKYTVDGGVLLACRLRLGDSAQPRWQIEVWDSGPGIPEAERERVFEEFYQLGNPERDHAAGLGLGLSIVRRLALLLGHRVTLHSLPGHGSRFVIEMPATHAPAAVAPAAALIGSIDGLGVAVVDDDPAARDSMTALLTRWGCDVVAGASGAEVLQRAGERAAQRLHAAVVDYQLRDGQTGIEAIRALRAVCGQDLSALLVSGASSVDRLAELKGSGFDWLSKPVRPARLRSWLVEVAHRGSV